jgi:outer membrane lipoprotein SlyB
MPRHLRISWGSVKAICRVSFTTYSRGNVGHLGGKSASCCIEKDTRGGMGDQLAQVIGLQSDRSRNNPFASM